MKMLFPIPLAAGLVAVTVTFAAFAADQMLFDFAPGFDLANVRTADAAMSVTNTSTGFALRVVTGHQTPWPGITLPAPGGHWDLSARSSVALQLKNVGSDSITVSCRVDNPGADGTKNCLTGSLQLEAGQAGTLQVALTSAASSTLGGKLFGMRGYPVATGGAGTIDPKNVTQLLVFVSQPKQDHAFEIRDLRATGDYTPPTAWVSDADPFFPFMDTLGQYRHKDWPGKTHSVAELAEKRTAEAEELTRQPGPAGWDKYGGWANGPQLEATGFFRAQKYEGKWWLVDPEGRLFFSQGIDCVRMLDATPIEERETWFADFPGRQPEFAAFLSRGYVLKGHYAGRTVETFSFSGANLVRKYGADWERICPVLIHQRLRSWGINTIGNWSDAATCGLRRTPYTDAVNSGRVRMIEGSEGYWGKFPDVFDASFAASAQRGMAGKAGGSANDPWCLGYFSDNEMSWGDEISLGLAALRSPADQAAKKALVADLQAKYGDIERLNQAWGTHHGSWDALLQSRQAPDKTRAGADLTAFYTRTAEQYFRIVREAIKAVAPHQLYLGCRFAWVNPLAATAAAKYCDVVSYNIYQRSVADFRFNGGADVPLIIGEFHFGALDRGQFHTGLVPTASQAARAQAYRDYVRGALRHPQFVGCHWFQYQDEPTTGRTYDEENYQIGFVDVADTPYAELIAASRGLADELYATRRKSP
jgi:hypothetical protein